jgi:hypothetical protein
MERLGGKRHRRVRAGRALAARAAASATGHRASFKTGILSCRVKSRHLSLLFFAVFSG